MADSFQQRISLEGAEDIIRNLQQIGSEATKAIGQLKTAVTSANPALATLSTTSLAAQNALKGFSTAVSQATTVITPFSASLGGLVSTLGSFAGPAGILAAAAGLGLFLKNAADSVITLDRQANALGLTIQQFQALSRVAKAAGLSQEEVATGLTRVAQQVAAQAQEQLRGVADLAKEIVSGNIPGLSGGQSILSKIIRVEDINKLRTVIQSIKPDLDAFLQAAGIPQPANQSIEQFTASILNLAKGVGPVAEGLRKILAVAANANTAVTPFEKIEEQLVKSENSLKSLRISFLNGGASALTLFESLQKISDELAKIPEGPGLTALEAKLGGRGIGPELLTALKNARGESGQLAKELQKIGIPAEAVAQAKALKAALADLESSGKRAQTNLLLTIGPAITTEVENLARDLKKLAEPQSIVLSLETPAGGFNLTFNEIKRSATDLVNFVKQTFASLDLGNLGTNLATAFNAAIDSFVQDLSSLGSKIAAALGTVDFSAIFSGIGTAVNAGIDLIVGAFGALPGRIVGALSSLPGQIIGLFQGIVNSIISLWDQVIQKFQSTPAPDISGGGGGGGGGGGFARGGQVWGPGTSTSDSILARLSRGEFVIRAAAVSHYGPDLLAALNAMRLPKLPGFALGGLAEGLGRTLRANLAIPSFAAGGLAPAPARAATVPIVVDLRTNHGRFRGSAMADRDVAEALSRFAVLDQITSMGKKSGAY